MIFACPVAAIAQSSTPLRVYVFRTGDEASDEAALEVLRERGHDAKLGVRLAHLLSADVRLSDYHVLVLLGRESENLTTPIVNILARYLANIRRFAH